MYGITLEPTDTSKRESSTTVVILGSDLEQVCNNNRKDESKRNGFFKLINLNRIVNIYVVLNYYKNSCKILDNTQKT
jgi:hypothetical protein